MSVTIDNTSVVISNFNNFSFYNYEAPSIELKASDIIALIMMFGIVLIGAAGNSIVIYIFGIKPGKSRKRFETFLLLLGIVDFISSLMVPFPFIYLTLTNYQSWHFGNIGCQLIPSFLQISVTVSQGVLILICFERYRAIVYPLNNRITKTKICIWLQFIAGLTVIVCAPYVMTFEVTSDPVYNVNTCVPAHGTISTLLASACINLIRDLFASFILIYLSYRMRRALLQNNVTTTTSSRAKFSEKSRRLLAIVIIVFLILTLPVDIFRVVTFTLFHSDVSISSKTYEGLIVSNLFLNISQMSNSVCNVFIYSRVHSSFYTYMKSVLRKRSVRSGYDSQTDESGVDLTGGEFEQSDRIWYSSSV